MAKDDEKLPAYFIIGKIIAYAMYLWVIFGIIVLGLRVFLLAFSANSTTPFVNFIYTTSQSFLNPFRGIFPPKPFGETGYLDVAALFAIIIYALIGWGFKALIDYVQAKSSSYLEHAQTEKEPEVSRELSMEHPQLQQTTTTRINPARPPRRV